MKSKSIPAILFVLGLLLTPLLAARAGEIPPPGSRPLSAILKSVEEQKLGRITEAEFDDGLWEVKICDGGACRKLSIQGLVRRHAGGKRILMMYHRPTLCRCRRSFRPSKPEGWGS